MTSYSFLAGSLLCALVLGARPSHAQTPNSRTIELKTTGMKSQMIRAMLSPKVVTIDAKTRTGVVSLSNPGTDTLIVELILSDVPSPPVLGGRQNSEEGDGLSALLADSASAKPSDSTAGANRSLVPWIAELPAMVRIAPKETKQLTIRLNVPESRTAGEYVGWVTAITTVSNVNMKSGDGNMRISFGNMGFRVTSNAKIVFRAE